MITVKDLLGAKRDELWTVPPNATVYRALEVMAEHDVGALPVVDGARLVGIFSERDYARRVVLRGRTSRETPVSDLMIGQVVCVTPEDTIQACMALMTRRRVRHLPVLEDDRIIGIVTIGDIVKRMLDEQAQTIEHLETYIRGTY